MIEQQSFDKRDNKEIIFENIYLHFFNREIYRGVYGEKIENMKFDHSDVLATILICGCNPLFGSFSAYRETIDILNDTGIIYRKLYDFGVISVTGETLSVDLNMGIKQEIYKFDRLRYNGYFGKVSKELDNIKPTIQKPDGTNLIDERLRYASWNDVLKYAPTDYDKEILSHYEKVIRDKVEKRENKAITKSLFLGKNISSKLPNVTGRMLSGMYVDDYMQFLNGDIITGIAGLEEYDYLGKNFPYHDYIVLRVLLTLLGFPKRFSVHEFEKVLINYNSAEHNYFALKVQELLHLIYEEKTQNRIIMLSRDRDRIKYTTLLKKCLFNLNVKKIDFSASNYYRQCIKNIDKAICLINNEHEKGVRSSMPNNKVFVVSGRNEKLRLSLFHLLRDLKLDPMEWTEIVENTGDASPYLSEAIKKSMNDAGAVIVIMAPEEEAQLIKELQTEPGDDEVYKQPRPNVIFEAGLALGIKESKTIILQFGDIRIFSDILGKHILKYRGKENSLDFKTTLLRKLQTAGCNCVVGNDYFHTDIDF